MKAQNDPLSWLNRGWKINEELRQLSPERVEQIRRIASFLQRLQKLEDDEKRGNLTPKDSENLNQLRNAKEKYTDLIRKIESLETSQ